MSDLLLTSVSDLPPDEGECVRHHPVAVVEAAQYGRGDSPGSPGQHSVVPQPPGGQDSPLQAGGGVTPGTVQGQTVEDNTVSGLTGPAQQLGVDM